MWGGGFRCGHVRVDQSGVSSSVSVNECTGILYTTCSMNIYTVFKCGNILTQTGHDLGRFWPGFCVLVMEERPDIARNIHTYIYHYIYITTMHICIDIYKYVYTNIPFPVLLSSTTDRVTSTRGLTYTRWAEADQVPFLQGSADCRFHSCDVQ